MADRPRPEDAATAMRQINQAWLDGHVEGSPARVPEGPRQPKDRPQVRVHAHRSAAGVPIELAQVAGVVEQGESRLDSPQLRQRGRTGVEAFRVRSGEHHHVHRLPHRPRPALDEMIAEACGGNAADAHYPQAGAERPDEPAPIHTPCALPVRSTRASSRRIRYDCT